MNGILVDAPVYYQVFICTLVVVGCSGPIEPVTNEQKETATSSQDLRLPTRDFPLNPDSGPAQTAPYPTGVLPNPDQHPVFYNPFLSKLVSNGKFSQPV